MRINVTPELKTFAGETIKEGDISYTVGRVLSTAAMSAPAQGQNYTSEEQIKRYQLGFAIHTAQDNMTAGLTGEDDISVEITADMASKLKADITRLFGPIIAGQVLPLLDGR